MPSIQIKNISETTYKKLKERAQADRRSLQQEAAWLLERSLDNNLFASYGSIPLHLSDWTAADRIRAGMEKRYGVLPDSTPLVREKRYER
jgi:plasmid stability protein